MCSGCSMSGPGAVWKRLWFSYLIKVTWVPIINQSITFLVLSGSDCLHSLYSDPDLRVWFFYEWIYLSPDSDPTPSPGFGLILDFFPGRLCLVGLKDWSGVWGTSRRSGQTLWLGSDPGVGRWRKCKSWVLCCSLDIKGPLCRCKNIWSSTEVLLKV